MRGGRVEWSLVDVGLLEGLALQPAISCSAEAAMNMARTLIRSDFGKESERKPKKKSGRTQRDRTG